MFTSEQEQEIISPVVQEIFRPTSESMQKSSPGSRQYVFVALFKSPHDKINKTTVRPV